MKERQEQINDFSDKNGIIKYHIRYKDNTERIKTLSQI
jgi:hypothetical protein